MSQLSLLTKRRFWPFFWTQFFGAFNDNLFKNALIILIAYKSVKIGGMGAEQLIAFAAGVFILPFFLFSASAGQLADRYPKAVVIKWVKAMEIAVMGVAALGFLLENMALLLAVLFLMGLQSTFFGPAKYSILPELVKDEELVGGNAVVETGTFVAILLGTIAGGVLAAMEGVGVTLIMVAILSLALFGYLTSLAILRAPAGMPELKISLNPITPNLETLRATRKNRPVALSVLGISWFWFLGASLLTLLPAWTKESLYGSEHVVTLLLAIFCVGIALGSLLCERLSGDKLELGLTPLGSIGISLFTFDLFFSAVPYADGGAPSSLLGLSEFLAAPGSIRILVDLSLISIFSGFYTVPLYTMIQQRSEVEIRSRVIAGNNILNALFMVGSAVMLMVFAAMDVGVNVIFLVLAVLNAAVAFYVYTIIPEFLLRFVAWILASVMYRIKVRGVERIPDEGAVVLVANHVSFIDWLFISSACRRPARFVMHHTYFKMPIVKTLFRDAKVIPIAPAHEDKETLDAAFDKIADELEEGEVVCIFPEGKLTKNGELNTFRTGIERILARTPVPVVPIALKGMWGSFFSRHRDRRIFKRMRAKVSLTVGEPLSPEGLSAKRLGEAVAKLGGWAPPEGE